MYATISADIVSSTSLSAQALIDISYAIKKCLLEFETSYDGFWGRLVKGDSIECVVQNPKDALRIALGIKTLIKSFVPDGGASKKFSQYGVRIAVAIDDLRIINRNLDIIDGEAIYLSGRAVSEKKTKSEMFAVCGSGCPCRKEIQIMVSMIDAILNQAKPRQCEAMYYKLRGISQNDISAIMDIKPPTVTAHLQAICWSSIEPVLEYYESLNL